MQSARYLLLAALLTLGGASVASAQAKLKWAHVYETGEPYHTQALWAAEEIKKKSNGKYQIDVFPASQLGNENQINEGLGLGTVDMIYTGVAFAGLLGADPGAHAVPTHDRGRSADEPRLWRNRGRMFPDVDPAGPQSVAQ